jgi:hypothetical protein
LDFEVIVHLYGVELSVEDHGALLSDLATDLLFFGIFILLEQKVIELSDDSETLVDILFDLETEFLGYPDLGIVVAETLHRHAETHHNLFGVFEVLQLFLHFDRISQFYERQNVSDASFLRSSLHQVDDGSDLGFDILEVFIIQFEAGTESYFICVLGIIFLGSPVIVEIILD